DECDRFHLHRFAVSQVPAISSVVGAYHVGGRRIWRRAGRDVKRRPWPRRALAAAQAEGELSRVLLLAPARSSDYPMCFVCGNASRKGVDTSRKPSRGLLVIPARFGGFRLLSRPVAEIAL